MEQKRNTSKARDLAIGFFGWVISHNLLWVMTFFGLVFLDLNYNFTIAAFEILMWLFVITASFFLFAKKKNWIGVGVIAAFLINVLLMLILPYRNGTFLGLPYPLDGLLNLT